jgi:lipoprotein-anchoring transpeptidase ErfK/SrfK
MFRFAFVLGLLCGSVAMAQRLAPVKADSCLALHPFRLEGIQRVLHAHGYHDTLPLLVVDANQQRMVLYQHGTEHCCYRISTGQNGVGNWPMLHCTPPGALQIVEKIGDGTPLGGVFRDRVFTGELASIERQPVNTPQDVITTRVLRLAGLQAGVNKGGYKDAFNAYIYIHGTHEEGLLGTPVSSGCIRMANSEVAALFAQVPVGTFVYVLY